MTTSPEAKAAITQSPPSLFGAALSLVRMRHIPSGLPRWNVGTGWQGPVRHKLVAIPGQSRHKRLTRTGSRMQSKSCAHHPGKDGFQEDGLRGKTSSERSASLERQSHVDCLAEVLAVGPLSPYGTSLAPKILNQLQ